MITEYLALLRADLCATTYNNRVCILREIFRTLADKACLENDPWEHVRLRPNDSHSRRELTIDELKRLLAAARRADSLEWQTLILIGIYTGLRLGDCCKLDWSCINIPQSVIQLIPSKTRRHAHGQPITIPIHPTLGASLLARTESGDLSAKNCGTTNLALDTQHSALYTGPVLPMIAEMYSRARWKVGHRLSGIFKEANITMSVKIEGRKNRTPEASFHSLRHTFVSLSANAGVPLHVVQSIVGHESTAMTRHYYHESVDALRNAVNAIPALG